MTIRPIFGRWLPFIGVRDLDADLAVELGRAATPQKSLEIEWLGRGIVLAIWEKPDGEGT